MTFRGVGLLVGGVALMFLGWSFGWPELTSLGAASASLVAIVLSATSLHGRVGLSLPTRDLCVGRGDAAALAVELTGGGRRMLRLVQGVVGAPEVTMPVSRHTLTIQVPVDTSRRGLRRVGPFRLVRGDPWSIVTRVVGFDEGGSILVRPRTAPVRAGFASPPRQRDWQAESRDRGDDHFFALRDYVLGDEPRNVHWRSTARMGRLVVRQTVAAASEGVLFVLDVDISAYGTTTEFREQFLSERFEAAVEVAAALCAAKITGSQRVQLATTAHGAQLVPGAALGPLLDALAVVTVRPPVETDPASLPSLLRRSRCSQLILVTGTASAAISAGLRQCHRYAPVVVRVGSFAAPGLPGCRTLDVADSTDLA